MRFQGKWITERRQSMRKLYVCMIAVLFSGVFFLGIGDQALANPNADPRCQGLSGAAFGMCAAAIAVGCDGETVAAGCERIEDNFTQITGEVPPWTPLPKCPCGDIATFKDILVDATGLGCTDEAGSYLAIDTDKQVSAIFSFYPYQGVGNKQTCGFDNTSLYGLTDEEAQSCINELRTTIENLQITCKVY
jgi:hypothetical protein